MDLKREAFTGAAYLAAVAVTLRRLYQPDFETPEAIRASLADVDMADLSWQRIATLTEGIQAMNTGWTAGEAPLAA